METNKLINHFSVFGYGYRNRDGKAVLAVKPEGTATVSNIYQYITSESARHATQPSRVHSVIVMPMALSTTRLIWLSMLMTWHPRPKPDS